jgi:hypothetical protein
MKKCLLFLAVAAGLMIGAPAYSQYFFVDVNGDALNSNTNAALPDDILNSGVTTMDIYVVTDKNRDGSNAICGTGSEPLSMNQYEFLLHTTQSGSVAFNTWTDNMGYAVGLAACGDGTICTAGADVWVGRGTGIYSAPGKYKLGTLGITVTGSPVVIFATSSSLNVNAQTGFGSPCLGQSFDNILRLGLDFTDSNGTESSTPVTPTTWGKIKKLYTN